jgi:hypothetical protein
MSGSSSVIEPLLLLLLLVTCLQLCFDFIERDSRLYCIECNPRTSSVITEFHDNMQLAAGAAAACAMMHAAAAAYCGPVKPLAPSTQMHMLSHPATPEQLPTSTAAHSSATTQRNVSAAPNHIAACHAMSGMHLCSFLQP